MDKYGLIGFPIAHSLSPRLFDAAYHGRYRYELIETPDFNKAWTLFTEAYKAVNVTAPFKVEAFNRADLKSPECERVGATNLCVKTPDGIKAYNSDYMGVKALIEGRTGSAAVIGFGGAGKAALAAAEDVGLATKLYRHNEISKGVEADVIIYTLPRAVDGINKLSCDTLIEANYKDPCLKNHKGYIPGTAWHLQQAILGYSLMTGEEPDCENMKLIYR